MFKEKFELKREFVEKFKDIKPPFGFNGLGELTYLRTYSRLKLDGKNEKWFETIERVVNGTYTIQKNHIKNHKLGWNEKKAQNSAQEMYERMFYMKFLPPGRGLWAMGSDIINTKGLYAALNNCAFVSTKDLDKDTTKPFEFLMDMSMLGVGVGFDVKGEGKINIYDPTFKYTSTFIIEDTREGWVNSLKLLLNSYFNENSNCILFDYSHIREKGQPIKTFGGLSSGPKPLMDLHDNLRKVLNKNIGKPITITTITDIMNLIGVCVVSGNVRRTAEIVFGPSNNEYLDLKNYNVNPERSEYGWTSNNSIFCNIGDNYNEAANRTITNGEPGYCWLSNMQEYSRMNGKKDNKDKRVLGGNPCLEQSLESYELCCLVETFPTMCKDKEDYLRTLKFAYLYAKTVTLGNTHWEETNRVMLRNRRIGTSMTDISWYIQKNGIENLRIICEDGYKTIERYDEVYSDWLSVRKSIKKTSIKPSGTVSLLPGVRPGIHYPESNYYIRRINVANNSPLLSFVREAGYKTEPSNYDKTSTIVEFPIYIAGRTLSDVSMWEQLELAAFMQKHWADNQVSCTITFKPEEAKHIEKALDFYQYRLKGISFLPKLEKGAYTQMPYEEISKDIYDQLIKNIKPLNISDISEKSKPEQFCDGENCIIN